MPDDVGFLERWLAGRDEPCPVCGQNLRDLRGSVCPECGSEIALTVTSDRLRPGPWLLGFASFALGLGFDAVAAILLTIPLILFRNQGGGPPMQVFLVLFTLVTCAAASGGGMWAMLRKRSAWRRMPPRAQRTLAAVIFIGVGLAHAAAGALCVYWMT
ncbi:MAG: hypothetical protein H6810_06850 [Phycisphaeraceae bacterium]|nr:MAG: hypothetical protein H6810_06850 [Phycisphaeraceae bacterium]